MAVTTSATATDEDVRPFTFEVPDEQLDDLRRCITRASEGGQFAAWQQPQVLAEEIRSPR
jgi:hypothetical protein